MIASLRGSLRAVQEGKVVIDVGGVGYLAHTPTSLTSSVRSGQTIELHTHLHVRENEVTLYGFQTAEELELFEVLITVTGVGPRTALAALSVFAPETLRGAIAQGNAAALTRIPGVGRKTAQRLVLDLKDKVGPAEARGPLPSFRTEDADVLNALTALGYSLVEAQDALAAIPEEATELDQRILEALRYLGAR